MLHVARISLLAYIIYREAEVVSWKVTLWRPLLPYGYRYKSSCARPRQAVIWHWHLSVFDILALWCSALSKITNDGLARSGTGCFIAVTIWQQWASSG